MINVFLKVVVNMNVSNMDKPSKMNENKCHQMSKIRL